MNKKQNEKKNHSFIRTLWGVYEHEGRRLYKRRSKIDNDITLLEHNQFNEPFVTYVFGEDNYKRMIDRGFDCRLVHKNPILWDMDTQQYRHKLEAFKQGLEEFDEIVFLDWDCQPVKPLPVNFWETLQKKERIQATLNMYRRKKAYWRGKESPRKVPCAEFVYVRGIETANEMIQLWLDMKKPWSEEAVMAKYTDEIMGGWDQEKFFELFEPHFFLLTRMIFTKEQYDSKNISFEHFHMKNVASIVKQLKKGNNLSPALAKVFK